MKRFTILLGLVSLLALGGLVDQALSDDCRNCEPNEALTEGGDQDPEYVLVREALSVKQTKYEDGATDLHFKMWQREDNIYVRGWRVCVEKFNTASSTRGNQPGEYQYELKNHSCCPETYDPDNGQHAIDVSAEDPTAGTVAKDEAVDIFCCFWLSQMNTKRMADAEWTQGQEAVKAFPDFGWFVEDPVFICNTFWVLPVEIRNDDPSSDLRLESVRLYADMDFIADLTAVPFSSYQPGFPQTLGPGQAVQIYAGTAAGVGRQHLYAEIVMQDSAGTDYSVVEIFHHSFTLPPAVPTTSSWGMIVLICLLVASGLVARRSARGLTVGGGRHAR